MKMLVTFILTISLFIPNVSFALGPASGLENPATTLEMAEMVEGIFEERHGPCPVNLETDTSGTEDICITLPQIKKAYAAFKDNKNNKKPYDLFAPKAPHAGGYLVAAGLEVVLADIRERRFTEKYIRILRQLNLFSEDFLTYLMNFNFSGDIDAVPEGTIISPGIPIMRITASDVEIALLEGLLKNRINLAVNIATKTARIVQAANGEFTGDEALKKTRTVVDFGFRRAQGKSAYLASRSAIIGGAFATSNVRAASLYGLKPSGTMAHLFVTAFPPEEETEAFRIYADAFPDSSIFLIDTYDTLEGARNACIVAKEMERAGHRLVGVRLDSGDLVKLSIEVRKILDEAGLSYVKIFASDDLDEEKITDLISRGATIDAFGVGTNLITGGSQPSLRLELQPSYGDNIFKITGKDGKVSRFVLTPKNFRTLNVVSGETAEEMLVPYWRNGDSVREAESVDEAKGRMFANMDGLPADIKRLTDAGSIGIQKQVVIDIETDALLVVDAQPTFMPGGGLPVTDGDKIMPNVRKLMALFPKKNWFATRDQHPKGHISLKSSYLGAMTVLTYDMVKDWTETDHRIGPEAKFTLQDLKDYLKIVGFQILWPDHAVEGKEESKLHPDIQESEFEEVVVKGTDPKVDSYSGFFDNIKRPTGLADIIRKRGFKRVFVVGLATDYCVGWSAEGAKEEGFEVVVIDDAAKPVCFPEGSLEKMYNSYKEKGIGFVAETDSITSTDENTQVISPIDTAKIFEHPEFTDKEERTALTEDMYHLTMGQALFKAGLHEKQATFDYFYRNAPYGRDSIVVAGLKSLIEELRRFRFTEKNIEYLLSLNMFGGDYLQYLKDFEFRGEIDAMEEGSIAFPREPIIRVRGTIFEAMIIETFLLNIMNFNSLEATWADETKKRSSDKRIIEDGLYVAQGRSHLEASRSAYIGGTDATTNLQAHIRFDIPLATTNEDGEWLGPDFITGGPMSSLGGVYKLAFFDGNDRIKLSDNLLKASLPGNKMVFAVVTADGNVVRRIIAGENERFALNAGERAVPLLRPIVKNGKTVHKIADIKKIRIRRAREAVLYKDIHSAELSKGLERIQSELIAHARAVSIGEEPVLVSSFKVRERSEPTFANINIMGPCNLDCRFCLGNDLKAEFDQYNNLNEHFNEWKNFKFYITGLKAKGITRVYITGQNTDPLIYRYLSELVDYLKQEGFYVGLRTNGVLAKAKMDVINKFDSVSYTLLSLSPDTLIKIAGQRYLIDWDWILSNTTTKKRVSIVVTRENAGEVIDLIKFLSRYKDISYIQVRKVATDTRYGLLKEDMRVFEELYKRVAADYPKIGAFELAPIFEIEGKEVVFWRTVGTTVNSWNYFTNGVYSDNYFIIEGYLENKYKTAVSDLHIRARFYKPKEYPNRFTVPDDKVDWGIPFPEYNPPYYVFGEVLDENRTKVQTGYADPEDISCVKLPERSYEGNILYRNGFPLNPKGRTGLTGRGALGKWGPNFAVDPIITRYNEDTKQYEMLAVAREDSDKLSIPGAILLDGEISFDAIKRRLGVKIGQDIPMDGAVKLYKGYVDDPRNTDNAWLETEVFHLNLSYELTRTFALQSKFGHSAQWMALSDESIKEMYANHGEFARLALVRLQPSVASPDQPKNIRDTLKRLLDRDRPALCVFDVHGVLLKATWKEEFRHVYREIMGEFPSSEWMDRCVEGKVDREVFQALCRESGKGEDEVKEVTRRVRERMRRDYIPEIMPGALDFVKVLKRANIPVAIMSGTSRELIFRQLRERGFLDYIGEEDIIGCPDSSNIRYDREKVLREIQTLYPNHQIVLFDNWIEAIAAVKKLGGISLGFVQGKGAKLAVNQQRLLQGGTDLPLFGWRHWHVIYQVLAAHNRTKDSVTTEEAERQSAGNRNKLRVAMAQINCTVGDMEQNRKKILNFVSRAKDEDVDLVVFPEMSITGYAPEDLVYNGSFIRDNIRTLHALVDEITGIMAIVGFIDADDEGHLYNAAAVISDGKLKGVYRKKALPNYGVLDEKRYFTQGDIDEIYNLGGIPFGVSICEDIWVDENGVYIQQAERGARVLINISASPYHTNKLDEREDLIRRRVMQTDTFIIYTNLVGGQDEVVYDGGSFVMGPDGKVLARGALFTEDLVIADLDLTQTRTYVPKEIRAISIERHNVAKVKKPIQPMPVKDEDNELAVVYNALVLGTRDYIRKNGFQKVVIGISGGIDSALVAAIAVDAVGKENVVGISMPSRYNSEETKSDARKLAENLGIEFKEIPIESVFNAYLETLRQDEDFAGREPDVTEENIQARIRGNILMAQSNKIGYIVLTTSNKSESAVGYATLYGDMAGGFAPIQDVYKTKVFELARFINSHGREIIPESTISRPPSAELREGQKDSDSLPPYELLDKILEAYLERNESIAQMSVRWDRAIVEKVAAMVDKNEYKRRQSAPGIKITRRNLGKEWRLPITNRYREGADTADSGLQPEGEANLTKEETTAVWQTVSLFRSQKIEILLPQSIELTDDVRQLIERIKKINGDDAFSYRSYNESNLEIFLRNKQQNVKRIIVATNEFSGLIENICAENPLLFRDERILNINLPSAYRDDKEKTEFQTRAVTIAIFARLFEKGENSPIEMLLTNMLFNYLPGGSGEAEEFMGNMGSPEGTASPEQIRERVLYFLGKIIRFSEMLEKEQKYMREFLIYA